MSIQLSIHSKTLSFFDVIISYFDQDTDESGLVHVRANKLERSSGKWTGSYIWMSSVLTELTLAFKIALTLELTLVLVRIFSIGQFIGFHV